MIYELIEWFHQNPEAPVLILHELDAMRMETKKIEIYRDGTMDFADNKLETGSTFLGEIAVPTLAEINRDEEFSGVEISKNSFDAFWGHILNDHLISDKGNYNIM